MAIRELSEAEFQATFIPPMRRLAVGEAAPVRLSLKEYVAEVIHALALPTSAADIEIHYVYVARDDSFTHVNFSWGVKNVFLAVVVDNRHEAIHGHRVLDFNKLYGLTS
jgi:hypothetical protein